MEVIGTNLALPAGTATAIGIGRPDRWTAMRLLAGLVMMGTGFVAHRPNHQAERYAFALRAIEAEEAGMVAVPGTQRGGARRLVVVALAGAGLLPAVESIRRLA